jgi:RimJ/RimL family protein N-acetyltransferase
VTLPVLATERLILRPLAMDDLDELSFLHAEESFWHYPFGRGWSQGETESFLERIGELYENDSLAVAAVVVADTEELAGWAGLAIPTFLPEILPAVEVGWRLGTQFGGKGFATEAGGSWIRYGFEVLQLNSIVSIDEPANVASGAVMDRLGFRLERETTYPNLEKPLHVTMLTVDAWGANHDFH